MPSTGNTRGLVFAVALLLTAWAGLAAMLRTGTGAPSASIPVQVSAASLGPWSAPGVDEQTLDDFRRHFRRMRERHDRVEAVLTLEGIESADVPGLLVPVLRDSDPEVVRAAVRVLGALATPEPRAALVGELVRARQAEVRGGLLQAIGLGGHALDRDLARAVDAALGERAWELRWRAVQALAGLTGEGVVPRLVKRTEDAEAAVRAAALDALAARRAREVLEPSRRLLNDDSWQVRAAAVAALAVVRDRESVPALIARLDLEEGRLIADITTALERLTARRFGLDVDAWKRFWATFGERYELPTEEQLEAMRRAAEEDAARYIASDAVQYHGLETPSHRIAFVIDVSGSMEALVLDRARFAAGGYPSFKRWDIVQTELMRTIDGLDPRVRFNVFSFATEVHAWRRDPVPANQLYKESAKAWVGRLAPIGGNEDLWQAELGALPPADLALGRTNTYGALMAALGHSTDARGRLTSAEAPVDTIFFLSDGLPTVGEYVDTEDILREVAAVNALRRVVIHTIAIGEFRRDFLQRLARDSGGRFLDLGR